MCLLAFAWQPHAALPLVLLGNRDEFLVRPAQAARFWPDAPWILGGRDLQEGGTWLGVTRSGRWATLTNYREPNAPKGGPSRGLLVSNFLRGDLSPLAYLQQVEAAAAGMAGFNLLVGDRQQVAIYSNRGTAAQLLSPGVYALSNHLLDSPWPKSERLKAGFRDWVHGQQAEAPEIESALQLLRDRTQPDDSALPQTGLPVALERLLATAFIESPGYGTRASSLLLLGRERGRLVEQSWLAGGEAGERSDHGFTLSL